MDTQRIEKVYTAYSVFYDLIFDRFFCQSRKAAIRCMEIAPESKVLEVGVGTGLSLPLYPRHCEVVGIDLCESMLRHGKKRVHEHRLDHVTLLKMDACRLEFEDNTFDAVSASLLISVVPNPRKVLQEMIRVCKENGRIVLLNHFSNGNKLIAKVERMISPLCTHIGFRTDLALDPLLEGMPLVIQKKAKVNPLRFWKLVQCRKVGGNGNGNGNGHSHGNGTA